MTRRVVTATYRLQLSREFPLTAARNLVPYLDALGVSHLYLSPVLAAMPGSTHGYDVTDHDRINPELGTEDDLRALAAELHARGMGIILDIVPNHMAASAENARWDDTLERGPRARCAHWFDIEWGAPHANGKVVLPVLGDELERVVDRGELTPRIRDSGARLAYFDKTFPLDPATLPKELQLAQLDPAARPAVDEWAAGDAGRSRLRALLDAQHYRLTFWRHSDEINYRRFFDISTLVTLRVETDDVFDATHARMLQWVSDGLLDGLRVDHIDGLRHPSAYLAKLRMAVDARTHESAPEGFPIIVEKILRGDETLPSEWPVAGTTGYDFLNDVEDLFVDPDGFAAIEASYRALRRNPTLAFRVVARDGKRRALTGALKPDVNRVAREALAWRDCATVDALATAIVELIVHVDAYRTYVSDPGLGSDADRRVLANAFRAAREHGAASEAALGMLEDAFFAAPAPADRARAELVLRLQQTCGPAAAKGVEDTAHYRYAPLASRNEVGGEPDRPLRDVNARVHARNAARLRDWPGTMLATNTHDTKRSADVRSRLDALTAHSGVWARHLSRWRKLNRARKRTVRGSPAPDTNLEHLYYQALLGLWPAPRPERRVDDLPGREWLLALGGRLATYVLKAAREAKTRTSWTDTDAQYEKAIEAFVRETLEPGDDAPFLPDMARLTALIADDGFRLAIARVLLHCTAPGVPDIYQGDELWSFTLVDPDNRRAVDFALRERLLEEVQKPELLRDALAAGKGFYDDRIKLALLTRLLRFRRDHASLVRDGDYLPLLVDEPAGEGLFAFARRSGKATCISIARTRTARDEEVARPTRLLALPNELEGSWRSVLTGRAIDLVRVGPQLSVRSDDLIAAKQPCDLLLRHL